eukprot:scaffold155542_cov32-Tisochrysis_lutea.AAC.3
MSPWYAPLIYHPPTSKVQRRTSLGKLISPEYLHITSKKPGRDHCTCPVASTSASAGSNEFIKPSTAL